jgi:hypothetical protein
MRTVEYLMTDVTVDTDCQQIDQCIRDNRRTNTDKISFEMTTDHGRKGVQEWLKISQPKIRYSDNNIKHADRWIKHALKLTIT